MKRFIKNIFIAVLLIIIFLLGYIRETAFLVVNSVLRNYPFPYNRSYITPPEFIAKMSDEHITILKWIMTLSFSLIFMGTTLFIVNFLFKSKKNNRLTICIYAILVVLSIIINVFGILTGFRDSSYVLSRFLIHLAQYPLLPLVLIALFYFTNSKGREISNNKHNV